MNRVLYARPALAGALLGATGALVACQGIPYTPASGAAPALHYPATARVEQVDRYFGDTVMDPYRWLENLDGGDTRAWIEAQNRLARPYLEGTPTHTWFKNRLTQLWNYERYGVPVKEGAHYFWLRNDGLQDQSVLYVAEALGAEPRVLIDPNALSKDATISMSNFKVSPNGRLVAYSLSDGGTDWDTWYVRDVASGRDLQDVLRYTKFTDVSWDRDSRGFYYSRYPVAADGANATGRGDDSRQVAIHHHGIGEPQSADRLVYAVTDHPTRNPYGTVSDDGRFLIINLFDSYAVNGIYYIDLRSTLQSTLQSNDTGSAAAEQVVRLLDEWQAQYSFLGNAGPELFFLTTDRAPRGRIVAIDVRRPGRASWREVVAESADVLDSAHLIGGAFVLSYLHDAHAQVKVVDLAGRARQNVTLPGLGKVEGFAGSAADPETFFAYTDFLTPSAVYRYDVAADRMEVFKTPQIPADTSPYRDRAGVLCQQGRHARADVHHRTAAISSGTARRRCCFTATAASTCAVIPAFSASVLAWLEAGGVYAVANLRGGSEYGETWHEAGTRLKKQNVFDDFIAAAEWLIAERYTSKQKIAALGRSNGGLLVGAVITQRPDLFAAALPVVGVLDMLRYHTASANARQWSSDYGLSENAEEYRALRAYSPYHNVRQGACYPPTLVTTADHDDRVVPWHSFKFAAALQAAQSCPNPVLIRVETRAGHGAGKPVWMQIEDVADQWAFLTRHLAMAPAAAGASSSGNASH